MYWINRDLPLGNTVTLENGDVEIGIQPPLLESSDPVKFDPMQLLSQLEWKETPYDGVQTAEYVLETLTSPFVHGEEEYTLATKYRYVFTKRPFKTEYDTDYDPQGLDVVLESGKDDLWITHETIYQTVEGIVDPIKGLTLRPKVRLVPKVIKKIVGHSQVIGSVNPQYPVFVHYVDETGRNLKPKVKRYLEPGKGLNLHRLEIEGYEYHAGMNFINSLSIKDEEGQELNPYLTVEDKVVGMKQFQQPFEVGGENLRVEEFNWFVEYMRRYNPEVLKRAGDAYLIYKKTFEKD